MATVKVCGCQFVVREGKRRTSSLNLAVRSRLMQEPSREAKCLLKEP